MEFNKEVIIRISKYLFVFLILYFSYSAIKYTPESIKELDSLGQHIPLAQSISEGRIFSPPKIHGGLGYYLPVGEIILALFIKIGIPLGFYNVLAIIILYYLCLRICKSFKFCKETSYLFALSIVSIMSLVRLIPTQKNDIWQIIFFLWSFYLIKNPKNKNSYYLSLGTALGLLIGVKYSGILFALFLTLIFYQQIINIFNFKKFILLIIPILLFGGIWYIRNYYLTGNPFYPVSILGFVGHPEFQVPRGIDTLLKRETFMISLDAYVSEFLVWTLIPFIIVLIKLKNTFLEYVQLKKLGIFTALTYLALPSEFTRVNITSNMRFLIPSMIIFILAFYFVIEKKKLLNSLFILVLLNAFSILFLFRYHPKMIFIWLLGITIYEIMLLNKSKIS